MRIFGFPGVMPVLCTRTILPHVYRIRREDFFGKIYETPRMRGIRGPRDTSRSLIAVYVFMKPRLRESVVYRARDERPEGSINESVFPMDASLILLFSVKLFDFFHRGVAQESRRYLGPVSRRFSRELKNV